MTQPFEIALDFSSVGKMIILLLFSGTIQPHHVSGRDRDHPRCRETAELGFWSLEQHFQVPHKLLDAYVHSLLTSMTMLSRISSSLYWPALQNDVPSSVPGHGTAAPSGLQESGQLSISDCCDVTHHMQNSQPTGSCTANRLSCSRKTPEIKFSWGNQLGNTT